MKICCISFKSNAHVSGGTNKEFNLRHDWHTLFSNDEQLEMRYYSTKYFPDADEYVSAHRAGMLVSYPSMGTKLN